MFFCLDSTIYSDCYGAYVNNKTFPRQSKLIEYGYNHQFECHKQEFVSGIFKHIHSNTVERFWRELKKDMKIKYTRHKYLLHIARFTFLRSIDREKQLKFISDQLHNYYDEISYVTK